MIKPLYSFVEKKETFLKEITKLLTKTLISNKGHPKSHL